MKSPIILLSVLVLPISGIGAEVVPLTTREQTVRPLALPADTR